MTFNVNRLKAERIAANMTQEEVAEKLGKKRTWYAKKESGIANVGGR
ncbi:MULTISPECIES: helix-turn-helix transcriptional regulator [unclassified Streptococcus]|nr:MULTISPECIES: helix-turn-helix transcriptional regulator [unclassified Streptococcus]MCQ9212261.1 helix-turn-helix transcriptional regulator [Streptococcus sp. B01]MCQ9213592.1 helix-turn-helix transcriptional regulator [Streptococcus sp. O1]